MSVVEYVFSLRNSHTYLIINARAQIQTTFTLDLRARAKSYAEERYEFCSVLHSTWCCFTEHGSVKQPTLDTNQRQCDKIQV